MPPTGTNRAEEDRGAQGLGLVTHRAEAASAPGSAQVPAPVPDPGASRVPGRGTALGLKPGVGVLGGVRWGSRLTGIAPASQFSPKRWPEKSPGCPLGWGLGWARPEGRVLT